MAKNSDKSPLARAQAGKPGQEASSAIAQSVVDRIVANSTPEFQDFLSRSGNGNPGMAAASFVPPAPVMPMAPPLDPMMGGMMPPAMGMMGNAPMPPPLMPSYQPPAPMNQSLVPPPPMLGMGGGPDSNMMLLRSLGLI